jgi:hypothetical protein
MLSIGLILLVAQLANAKTQTLHEQRIVDANRIEASYSSAATLVRNAEIDTYLSDLIQRITANIPEATTLDFRMHAMQSAFPYVNYLDNGAIYISTGLLARLQNESQLAALITTEIASAPMFVKYLDRKDQINGRLQLGAYHLAYGWLQQNGFDIAEAPRAVQCLLDTVCIKNRCSLALPRVRSLKNKKIF